MSDDSSQVQYQFAAAQQGDQLVLTITNKGAADKPAAGLHVVLVVEIPSVVLPEALQRLAQTAADNNADQLLAGDKISLAGGAGAWSAWVQSSASQQARIGATQHALQQTATVQLALKNDSDSSGTGVDASSQGWIPQNKPLTLSLPVSLKKAIIAELVAQYGYGAEVDPVWGLQLSDDTLVRFDVRLAPPGSPSLPAAGAASEVQLRLSDRGRAYVPAGTEATIHWSLPDGVEGTLFGPLSGGHTSQTVTGSGQQTVYVVTHQAYVLQAEVEGVLVARTLVLDVQSPDKSGYLELEPAIALPYGVVRAHWAVRAVSKAFIAVDKDRGAVLHEGVDDDFSGYGVYDVLVKTKQNFFVSLGMDVRAAQWGSADKSLSAPIQVYEWQPWSLSGLPGEPLLALAYAAGTTRTGAHEALLACTGSALFLCTSPGQGETDEASFIPLARDAAVALDCWLDVSATSDGFVALRRLKSGAIELVVYDVTGSAIGVPTAPPQLQGMAAACVRVLGERAYVIGSDNQSKAVALSLNLSHPLEAPVVEPALSFAKDAAFVVVGDALYALHRQAATLLRYEQKEKSDGSFGTLSTPAVASAAPADAGALLGQCALVAVEGLLVALGNGWQTCVKVNDQTETWPQDLVYNPQTDGWTTCGHGLDCDQGWRVVYRNGQSPRLWALNAQKPAESKTLFVPDEHLFAADYWAGVKDRPLTTSCLSATQTFSSKLPANAALQAVEASNPVFLERLEDGSLRIAYNAVSTSHVPGLWATGAEGNEIPIPGCWATFGGVRYCLAWGSAVLSGLRPQDLDLSDTDFTLAPALDFSRAMLAGANLQRATLSGVNLSATQLTNAKLTNAHLEGASLVGARLDGADLSGAFLQGADLTEADLRGATITGAHVDYNTLWPPGWPNPEDNLIVDTSSLLPAYNLNGFDLVAAVSQDALNKGIQHLFDTGVIDRSLSYSTSALREGRRLHMEFQATLNPAPKIEILPGPDYRQKVVFSLFIDQGTFIYGSGEQKRSTTFSNVVVAFDVGLGIQSLVERNKGKVPQGVQDHLSQYSPEEYEVRHLLLDFTQANFAKLDATRTKFGELASPGHEQVLLDFRILLYRRLTDLTQLDKNPYLLHYHVEKASIQPGDELAPTFGDRGGTFSTTYNADQPGRSTVNILMMTGGKARPADQTATVFAKPWLDAGADGRFAIARAAFWDGCLLGKLKEGLSQGGDDCSDVYRNWGAATPSSGDTSTWDDNKPADYGTITPGTDGSSWRFTFDRAAHCGTSIENLYMNVTYVQFSWLERRGVMIGFANPSVKAARTTITRGEFYVKSSADWKTLDVPPKNIWHSLTQYLGGTMTMSDGAGALSGQLAFDFQSNLGEKSTSDNESKYWKDFREDKLLNLNRDTVNKVSMKPFADTVTQAFTDLSQMINGNRTRFVLPTGKAYGFHTPQFDADGNLLMELTVLD